MNKFSTWVDENSDAVAGVIGLCTAFLIGWIFGELDAWLNLKGFKDE